jgi:hypothetical protein
MFVIRVNASTSPCCSVQCAVSACVSVSKVSLNGCMQLLWITMVPLSWKLLAASSFALAFAHASFCLTFGGMLPWAVGAGVTQSRAVHCRLRADRNGGGQNRDRKIQRSLVAASRVTNLSR